MSNQSIQLEVFPTTASCSAGCEHCPLSRRLDKTPFKVNSSWPPIHTWIPFLLPQKELW